MSRLMYELFMAPLGALSILIAVPTVGYLLIGLFDGFPKLRLRQVAGIIAVAAWIFTPVALHARDEGPFLFVSVVVLMLIFLVSWRREFRLLMLRRDDEFPGRFDKAAWVVALTLFAPAGIWLYRSFRKARWTEEAADKGRPGPSSPWDLDDEDAVGVGVGVGAGKPSHARAGVE